MNRDAFVESDVCLEALSTDLFASWSIKSLGVA